MGHRINAVAVHRLDVIEGSASPRAMLCGSRIKAVLRHGKRLAIVAASGRALEVQLGMTGALLIGTKRTKHQHVTWSVSGGMSLAFVDPRRFGGVRPWKSERELRDSWAGLGPDALLATVTSLTRAIGAARRPIKALLLDQSCIAGIGNIYADEILHASGIDPRRSALLLTDRERKLIASRTVPIMRLAVRHGGSTIRDYQHTDGSKGGAQLLHRVYGRAGLACLGCSRSLMLTKVAGRTTVLCSHCQK